MEWATGAFQCVRYCLDVKLHFAVLFFVVDVSGSIGYYSGGVEMHQYTSIGRN